MKNPPSSAIRRRLYRVALDYRDPEPDTDYPGFGEAKKQSAEQQADENLYYIWNKNAKPSRYGDGRLPVLYTAKARATCYSEVGFHLQEFYSHEIDEGDVTPFSHIGYYVSVSGTERDFFACEADFPLLCEEPPSGYSRCQSLANIARADGVDSLRVPSARRPGFESYPILNEGASGRVGKVDEFTLDVSSNKDFITVTKSGRKYRHNVSRR